MRTAMRGGDAQQRAAARKRDARYARRRRQQRPLGCFSITFDMIFAFTPPIVTIAAAAAVFAFTPSCRHAITLIAGCAMLLSDAATPRFD